jgi:thiopeptide-type bacteriocin biosynthesis protein
MWLAAYIFAKSPWENLLKNAVKPFAEKILNEKKAEQYFFIRYWENGPHIRLRFKGEHLGQKIQQELKDYFSNYLTENPSREDKEWEAEYRKKENWFPPDSIQFIEYEPETKRYGGKLALDISEQQFQASSDACLKIITESEEWNYSRALGAAIQLHLGFAHALGMSLYELSHFCDVIFRGWFPRAFAWTPEMSKDEYKQKSEETLKLFDEQFQKQKDSLFPYHEMLWQAFEEDAEFEQEWLNTWVLDMKKIREKLEELQQKNKIEYPSHFETEDDISISKEKQQLWSLYESYVHMTNNRLGIFNQDEAYLGYLIKACVSEMMKKQTTPF